MRKQIFDDDKEKSYAESLDKKPFDWHEFLSRKAYTENELHLAYGRAISWVTCACGNQCARIPRKSNGSPRDTELANLGVKFANYVQLMFESANRQDSAFIVYQREARAFLAGIEARSAYLIRQLDKLHDS
jgi:hypothetical protein